MTKLTKEDLLGPVLTLQDENKTLRFLINTREQIIAEQRARIAELEAEPGTDSVYDRWLRLLSVHQPWSPWI